MIGAATVLVADYLPDQYRSETLILVIPQRVPEEYVRSTVTDVVEDRLRTISQQILSRTRLEQVIEEMDLYPQKREALPMQDVVEDMREQIELELVQGSARDPVNAFRLSYEAGDPQTAMTVTERLADMFINENLRERELLAAGTSAFLEGQLESARQELIVHEQKLEEYKRRYYGQLPSELTTNLQVIQNLQFQLQSVSDSINRDRDRLHLVERSIADFATDAIVLSEDPDQAPAAVRLQAARNALQGLEARFRPNHPDIVKLNRFIEELEEEVLQAGEPTDESEAVEDAAFASPADAARRSRLRELEAERDLLERQIAYRSEEQQRLQEQMNAYQSRVEAVPAREAELVELTRDYDTLRSIYETLLAKREDSRIAENLERRQIGEQFRVLDPANLPGTPDPTKPAPYQRARSGRRALPQPRLRWAPRVSGLRPPKRRRRPDRAVGAGADRHSRAAEHL